MTEGDSEPTGAPLYFSHPASLGHLTGDHPEQPARITAIEEELERRDFLGYERREAPEATYEALCAVHAEPYVERVRSMAEGAGGFLDASETTVAGPGSWPAALHAAGGACALAGALLAGEAAVGFSATRPPGHHAAWDTTSGFCLFNNVAVAARHALDSLGADRVFILDWDVHHGDGTNDIFRADSAVLYASIHQLGLFPGTGMLQDAGAREGEGFSINLPVPPGSDEEVWVSLLEHIIVPAAAGFRPDLILISAGFDAHEDDLLGGCLLDSGSFAEMARHVRDLGETVGAPVGAVLEGGYTPAAVAVSVADTMAALASDEEPDSIAPHYLTSQAASFVGHFWEL
jgi:acetoin utilization deacetylase AcuC-like enzyme